jgi:hypothetical protein
VVIKPGSDQWSVISDQQKPDGEVTSEAISDQLFARRDSAPQWVQHSADFMLYRFAPRLSPIIEHASFPSVISE